MPDHPTPASAPPGHGDPLHTASLHPLGKLSVLVRARVVTVAERHGLTAMQGRLLGLIDSGPRPMAELSRELGIEKATLTGLVGRAESRGLVVREVVPENRRSTRVRLTPHGAATAGAFYRELADSFDAVLGVLPPEDRDRFTDCTLMLVEALGGPDPPDRGAPCPGSGGTRHGS
ncbi:MarR family winged helix-turn-helix transcriptional regulator [Pseudonocardia sp. ICBG1293]|uniref:MarR family winged helix-turn-helix transcriptional regulator n=1 Tax=Pseudonocardia sp. ICBG1293 TaxID=2844382 RepID=UPI001CCA8F59|nr:MarR family winged helix-turn-helix transcriptional regulator [Pseudonocardia sp. ICBG1293]